MTYDSTLGRPVRVAPSADAVYRPDAKANLAALVALLDIAVLPFQVRFLKAKVHTPEASLWPLDMARLAAGLQLYYLRAQASADLLGDRIRVDLSLTAPSGDTSGDLRARVACFLPVDIADDPTCIAAVEAYSAAVEEIWVKLAKTTVGPWALDNGISDLRLMAEILVDPEIATTAFRGQNAEASQTQVH